MRYYFAMSTEPTEKRKAKIKRIVELVLTIIILLGIAFLFKKQIREAIAGKEELRNDWPADIPEHPWYQDKQ